jgi:micrococcal nuclease
MLRNAALLWIVVVVLAGGAVSDTAARRTAAPSTSARVARVIDGDTIVLADGVRVRLVQIDTPEVGTGECFSRAAGRELRAMLPAGAAVTLVADPRLDRVDRYGRLLRYVLRDGRNVNLELVRRGAATVWLYDGRPRAVRRAAPRRRDGGAKGAPRSLGGLPARGVEPLRCREHRAWVPRQDDAARPIAGTGPCDPSYPTVCIPPPPPDLDCRDVTYRNFPVRPPDPHHFDGEGDGFGCESS